MQCDLDVPSEKLQSTSRIIRAKSLTAPAGSFKEVGGGRVEARDNVYVSNRDAHPVTNSRLPGESAVWYDLKALARWRDTAILLRKRGCAGRA
jgi:hypothetical protein